mmetsp:Transcript_56020/g.67253  ORF Transcript_56020/g.67253 Transcript_56020/m.67253 type:complete len:220 (-) Transcript_56020:2525-3184(-)
MGAIEDIIFILTRLPFGSSPAPSEFWVISESVFDLGNDIISNKHWDSKVLFHEFESTIPQIAHLSDDIPFDQAQPVDFPIPHQPLAKINGFIDDSLTIALDAPDSFHRAKSALPLSIDCIFRNKATNEPMAREDILQAVKMLGEGFLCETKIFLDWLLLKRQFQISLTKDKVNAWEKDILSIIKHPFTSINYLESLIGKLNHATFIISKARHFLNHLRK